MAASPVLQHELEAASTIRKVMEAGGYMPLKPNGRIGVYRYQNVPMNVLHDVRTYYPQIRVLLARMAQ